MLRKICTTMTRSLLAVTLLLGSLLHAGKYAGGAVAAGSPDGPGVNVEFYAHPVEGSHIRAGEDLRVGFRISDSHSGETAAHMHPAAWLTLRRPERSKLDGEACESQIAALLRKGLIHTQADADLNSFYILTLNADSSIGIIDPTVNLNTANLLALIRFQGEPAEWALDEERGKVFVTLPKENRVAVADISRRRLHGYLEVGAGPRRLLLPPEGRYVWVGNEEAGTVSVIDRESLSLVHTFHAGAGPLDLAADDKDRFAFIGSGGDGHLSIIDIRQMAQVARLEVGQGGLALAWSPLSAMLYVANGRSGAVEVIEPEKRKTVNRIELTPGVTALRPSPDGRFLLALSPAQRKVKVIDAAWNRMAGELLTEAAPDHILFTTDFIYIRNRVTPNVSVIQRSRLEDPASAAIVSVPFGSVPPGEVKGLAGVNTMEVFPHGGHILNVNPADRMVYLYMEGMMVPMNSFKTYTDRPLGLLVHNRGLREWKTEGDYTTIVRLEEPGVYDVPFFLDSPRVAACFELMVHANPEAEKKRPPKPAFSSLFDETPIPWGEAAKLHFKLYDEHSGAPLTDVEDILVMSFHRGSHWQHRAAANHLGEGLYEAEFTYPREGKYFVLIEARSIGISFGDLRHGVADVRSVEGSTPLAKQP